MTLNFTPHLMSMNRGILSSIYVRLTSMATVDDLRATLGKRYAGEPFVHVLDDGAVPATRHVRGSNHCLIGVFADRVSGRAIHPVGDRQPGEGSLRPGHPEHEPGLRPRRDHRPHPRRFRIEWSFRELYATPMLRMLPHGYYVIELKTSFAAFHLEAHSVSRHIP